MYTIEKDEETFISEISYQTRICIFCVCALRLKAHVIPDTRSPLQTRIATLQATIPKKIAWNIATL